MDIRDAFFEALFAIAARDRNVVLLTDDQGAFTLEKFKKELAGQYINVGIAEQNLVTVAAGLALAGKIPFVYGIATFLTFRCYEQIKLDLCAMNLGVTLIGSGAGYTYGSDGPTHHATLDVSVMRALPEMAIYNPCDAVMTAQVAQIAYRSHGPTYVRLEKGILPQLYKERHDFSKGYELLRPGQDLLLISTGFMVHQALQVADELAKRSIRAGVIDLYRVQPVEEVGFKKILATYPRVVTLEEHSIAGGIGTLTCELLSDQREGSRLKRLGLPHEHTYEYGSREWLQARKGLSVEEIVRSISEWMKS